MNMGTKNVLVIGGSGFVGSNYLNYSKKLFHKILSPSHKELDLLNVEQLKKTFDQFVPEVVVNFAAHRDANSAELQRNDLGRSAWKTNVEGVNNLSKISSEYGSFLIHISTDMVFPGSKNNPGKTISVEIWIRKLPYSLEILLRLFTPSTFVFHADLPKSFLCSSAELASLCAAKFTTTSGTNWSKVFFSCSTFRRSSSLWLGDKILWNNFLE